MLKKITLLVAVLPVFAYAGMANKMNAFFDKLTVPNYSTHSKNKDYFSGEGAAIKTDSKLTQVLFNQDEEQSKSTLIKMVSHKFGLFWFYNGKNQIAQAMAPSLQDFADEYHIKLIGISMDHITLNAIHDNKLNQGQAQKLRVAAYPAVFLINPDQNSYSLVAYGFTSINTIKESILNIAKQYGEVKLGV